MTAPDPNLRPKVGVGVFVFNEEGQFLMGLRQGFHDAGVWGLPGGHMEYEQTPEEAASQELEEEVALIVPPRDILMLPVFTNDVFPESRRHYITLYGVTTLPCGQIPENMEPEKCGEIGWFDFGCMPSSVSKPIRHFLEQQFRPTRPIN